MFRGRKFISFVGLFIALIFPVARGLSAQEIRLAIVHTDSLESTLRAIKGIRSTISASYSTVNYTQVLLPADSAGIAAKLSQLRQINPKLILTVGTQATNIIADNIPDKPIVFSAVLNPVTSGFVKSLINPGGNITGSSLDIPPDIQFNYFKRVVSGLKKIGVLYTKETANLIPPAKVLAKAAGLELEAIEIISEKELPAALDRLIRSVDALWSVADQHLYSPNATKFILLNTLRNGKPLMGFSKNLVESGALFALDYDYKDIGKQAGQIAIEIISGKPPASTPVAVPGVLYFHYNEKTAKHINLVIPDDLVAVAKEVFR